MQDRIIVVAKHSEDVSWTTQIQFPVIVFDKGGTPGEHALPNVGRESHTYLHYFSEYYDDLPKVVVCTQGNPLPHQPRFIEMVNSLPEDTSFLGLAEQVIEFERNGAPQHCGLPLDRVFQTLFGRDFPETDSCTTGGLFAVSRSRIKRHSRQFYSRCRELLAYDANPIEGYVFERLWQRIFAETAD